MQGITNPWQGEPLSCNCCLSVWQRLPRWVVDRRFPGSLAHLSGRNLWYNSYLQNIFLSATFD